MPKENRDGETGGDKGARPISAENHQPEEKARRRDTPQGDSAGPIVEENGHAGRG